MGLTSALNWGFMLIWFGLVGMARLPSAKSLANRKLQAISSRQAHASLFWITWIHMANSYLMVVASKEGWGALPRWRPPPHPF